MLRALLCSLAAASTVSAQTPDTVQDSSRSVDPFRVVGARIWTLRVDSGSRAATRTFSQELTGKLPGVLVMPSSGAPSSGSRLLIRGVTSALLGNAPLIYVDGVRVEALAQPSVYDLLFDAPQPYGLDDLDPEDVATVEVLPGPAAASRFGSDAANGVLWITTRRGEWRTPHWHVYSEQGAMGQSVPYPQNYLAVDSTGAQCTLMQVSRGQCRQDGLLKLNVMQSPLTSPVSEGAAQTYGTSVAGLASGIRFYGAGRLETDGGVYGLPASQRDPSGSTLPQHVLNPSYLRRTHLRGSLDVPLGDHASVGVTAGRLWANQRDPGAVSVIAAGLTAPVTRPPTWDSLFRYTAPLSTEHWTGAIRGRWSPSPLLSLDAVVGRDHTFERDSTLGSPMFSSATRTGVRRSSIRAVGSSAYRLGTALSARTSAAFERVTRKFEYARFDYGPGGSFSSMEIFSSTRENGYLLAQDLTYRDRLMISAAVRDDRPRYFRAEVYPSFSASYAVPWDLGGRVEHLRLGAAYGVAGGSAQGNGFVETERTREFEFNVDADFLHGRLAARLTGYDKRTGNAVVPIPPGPGISPSTSPNALTVANRGLEGTLALQLASGTDLAADLRLSFWGNRNRVVRLDAPAILVSNWTGQIVQQGLPMGGYMWWPYSYVDRNRDGLLDTNEVRIGVVPAFMGTPFPTQGASLAVTTRWRGWLRLTALLEYRAGNSLINFTEYTRCSYLNPTCRAENDPTAPLADQARAVARLGFFSPQTAAGFIEDADFARLRELTLTLTAPAAWAHRAGASALRLTLAGRNLLRWTHYRGLDPEVNWGGENGLTVVDYFTQPPLRFWTARLDLDF